MSCALLNACPALIQLVASATCGESWSGDPRNSQKPDFVRTIPAGIADRLQRESLHARRESKITDQLDSGQTTRGVTM